MSRKIEVQSLRGRRVLDREGELAGRIATFLAERDGPQCRVTEVHLGTAAFLDMLGISARRLIGVGPQRKPLRAPWHLLDLSDPDEPRLRCTRKELEALQDGLEGEGESEVP